MKTDSLFYFLFQTAPGILFELLGESASLAVEYEFRSIELKQTAFRLDGVLLPRTFSSQKTVYFIEIQFQQDPYFYHRFFAEIFLFLRQNSQTIYCQAVIIFANRNIEPRITPIQQTLLDSEQVQRIYLEDLEDLDSDSLSIGLVQLIAVDSKQAITQAKNLLAQAQQETSSPLTTTTIIELIETIIVYKFPKLIPRRYFTLDQHTAPSRQQLCPSLACKFLPIAPTSELQESTLFLFKFLWT